MLQIKSSGYKNRSYALFACRHFYYDLLVTLLCIKENSNPKSESFISSKFSKKAAKHC